METIGNIEYEMEYYSGKVLRYEGFPRDICELSWLVASLPDVDTTEDIDKLKKILVNKQKKVNESVLYRIYKGTYPELLELFESTINILEDLSISMVNHKDFLEREHFQNTLNGLSSLEDYSQIGLFVNTTPTQSFEVGELEKKIVETELYIKNAESIVSIYGVGEGIPTPKTERQTGNQQELLNLCLQVRNEIAQSTYPIKIVYLVGTVTDTIQNWLTANPLDPYYVELAQDMFKICSNPESFQSEASRAEVPREVGNIYVNLYTEFAIETIQLFLKEREGMNESKAVGYEEALSLDNDNGDLVNVCSQYINRVYNQT